jgi:uroporphyrinogen-III synthase
MVMTVLLLRANRNNVDRDALLEFGIDSLTEPYLSIRPVANVEGATRLLEILGRPDPVWLIITSANALTHWYDQCPPGALEALLGKAPQIRYAAIGEQTADVLRSFGVSDILVPTTKDSRTLAELIAEFPPSAVVIPGGTISMKSLPSRLVPAGFDVVGEVFYATEPVHDTPRSVALIAQGVIDTVLLRSPSAARTFFAFNPHPPSSLMVVCGGETTAAEVRALGFSRVVVAPDPSPAAIARVIASLVTGGPR